MELVSHVAKEQHDEEKAWNVQFQNIPRSDKQEMQSSFVFSESMLGEFLYSMLWVYE